MSGDIETKGIPEQTIKAICSHQAPTVTVYGNKPSQLEVLQHFQ